MVIRVNPLVQAEEAHTDQVPGRGTVRQLADYLLAAHTAGADEVLVDLQQTARSGTELIALAHQLHELLRQG